MEDIQENINKARIIVAELSTKNANVFYKVGIAHTVGKEVILIVQNTEDVPFDLKHLRCVVYDYSPRGAKMLEKSLKNTILITFLILFCIKNTPSSSKNLRIGQCK